MLGIGEGATSETDQKEHFSLERVLQLRRTLSVSKEIRTRMKKQAVFVFRGLGVCAEGSQVLMGKATTPDQVPSRT